MASTSQTIESKSNELKKEISKAATQIIDNQNESNKNLFDNFEDYFDDRFKEEKEFFSDLFGDFTKVNKSSLNNGNTSNQNLSRLEELLKNLNDNFERLTNHSNNINDDLNDIRDNIDDEVNNPNRRGFYDSVFDSINNVGSVFKKSMSDMESSLKNGLSKLAQVFAFSSIAAFLVKMASNIWGKAEDYYNQRDNSINDIMYQYGVDETTAKKYYMMQYDFKAMPFQYRSAPEQRQFMRDNRLSAIEKGYNTELQLQAVTGELNKWSDILDTIDLKSSNMFHTTMRFVDESGEAVDSILSEIRSASTNYVVTPELLEQVSSGYARYLRTITRNNIEYVKSMNSMIDTVARLEDAGINSQKYLGEIYDFQYSDLTNAASNSMWTRLSVLGQNPYEYLTKSPDEALESYTQSMKNFFSGYDISSGQDRMMINTIAQQVFGMGSGDMQDLYDLLEGKVAEKQMTDSDRLDSINDYAEKMYLRSDAYYDQANAAFTHITEDQRVAAAEAKAFYGEVLDDGSETGLVGSVSAIKKILADVKTRFYDVVGKIDWTNVTDTVEQYGGYLTDWLSSPEFEEFSDNVPNFINESLDFITDKLGEVSSEDISKFFDNITYILDGMKRIVEYLTGDKLEEDVSRFLGGETPEEKTQSYLNTTKEILGNDPTYYDAKYAVAMNSFRSNKKRNELRAVAAATGHFEDYNKFTVEGFDKAIKAGKSTTKVRDEWLLPTDNTNETYQKYLEEAYTSGLISGNIQDNPYYVDPSLRTNHTSSGGGTGFKVGTDYIPYDNYPALLHKGERVLTASENKNYNNSKLRLEDEYYDSENKLLNSNDLLTESIYDSNSNTSKISKLINKTESTGVTYALYGTADSLDKNSSSIKSLISTNENSSKITKSLYELLSEPVGSGEGGSKSFIEVVSEGMNKIVSGEFSGFGEGTGFNGISSTGDPTANGRMIWNYLKEKGFSDAGIAGIMGNLYAESGLMTNNLQNSYNSSLGYSDAEYTNAVNSGDYSRFVGDSAGYGLAQWTSSGRKKGLLQLAQQKNASIDDIGVQLDWLMMELDQYGLLNSLRNANSVYDASTLMLTKFERPKNYDDPAKARQRASYGNDMLQKYGSGSFATGGLITDPTLALMGEGGYPEYIISTDPRYNDNSKVLLAQAEKDILSASSRTLEISVNNTEVVNNLKIIAGLIKSGFDSLKDDQQNQYIPSPSAGSNTILNYV